VVEYVAARNPTAARRLGERILVKADLIRKHPRIGARFRLLDRDDVREFPVPPVRLIYRIQDDIRTIHVLTVWHGTRDEPELDGSESE